MKESTMPHKKLSVTFLDFDDIKNPLLAAGQAHATLEVAQRLVKRGHRVTVVCSRFPRSTDSYHQGIFYQHIGLGSGNIKLNNLVFFLVLPLAVRKLTCDIIVECFTAPISTCFSPLFTKVPVIGMPTMFEAEQFTKKYHLPFHWVERFGCTFYRYFLAYSPANQAKMQRLNPNVFTRIIPNGVSESFFTQPVEEGDYGVFIGRIDIVQKGLDLLLQACRLAGARLSKKIILAGNGPKAEEQRLQKLIADNGLADRVTFVGRVDGEKKKELLAHAAFGIYPSRFEDFPLVPLEVASLAKPLVCFDITGLSWVPHTVALKARAFEVESLTEVLVTMSNNSQLRRQLSGPARAFASTYGWDAITGQYEEFFHDVIKRDEERERKS